MWVFHIPLLSFWDNAKPLYNISNPVNDPISILSFQRLPS